MTQSPKEKANELLDKYWLMDFINPSLSKQQSKQCALIAVDELIQSCYSSGINYSYNFWKEVKEEILKL